ncbi:MAG: hypothetical protein ACFFCW_03535 [Candidatus Hodarchaeota archaeon]
MSGTNVEGADFTDRNFMGVNLLLIRNFVCFRSQLISC